MEVKRKPKFTLPKIEIGGRKYIKNTSHLISSDKSSRMDALYEFIWKKTVEKIFSKDNEYNYIRTSPDHII